MKQIIFIGAVIMIIVAVGVVLFKYGNTPDSAIPQQGEEISLQAASHIAVNASHEPYNSNPPTSGPHYAEPANWGVYSQPLPDEQLVHNLEHGGIWISYKDLDPESIVKLQSIANRYPGSVILTPRPANDSKIALASWGRLTNMNSVDEKIILNFIKGNKNKSPEPIAR